MSRPYYRTCPYCGAALDPGERCDCLDALEAHSLPVQEATPKSNDSRKENVE